MVCYDASNLVILLNHATAGCTQSSAALARTILHRRQLRPALAKGTLAGRETLRADVPHSTLFNYVLYQAGWFACILGAAWHQAVTGFGLAMLLTVVHVWRAEDRAAESRLILLALALGIGVEGIQVWNGTYAQFTSGRVMAWMSPPWLLAMWAQFATTFRFSMRGVMSHPWRATAFGALGGPIAFLAGERLGAVTLTRPLTPALLSLSLAWGIALYLCARATHAIAPARAGGRYRP